MGTKLAGIKLAVVGGDQRQIVLVEELLNLGAEIKVLGLPNRKELVGCKICNDLLSTIENVHTIILPMPGTDNDGNIISALSSEKIRLTEAIFQQIPNHVPIFLGVAKPFLKEWARFYRKKLIEIADVDEIAILNSIPTAEGALRMAMEELAITIHSSNSMVIGFGRCGKTLARTLNALGAKTTVFARKPADLARIKEMGLVAATYEEMPAIIEKADVIFNSVPTQILDEKILKHVKKETVIIDIASAPGGTDFSIAQQLGIKAKLAPSLPGKYTPKTAGLILAQTLPDLILKEVSLPNKNEVGGKV